MIGFLCYYDSVHENIIMMNMWCMGNLIRWAKTEAGNLKSNFSHESGISEEEKESGTKAKQLWRDDNVNGIAVYRWWQAEKLSWKASLGGGGMLNPSYHVESSAQSTVVKIIAFFIEKQQ